MRHYCTYFDSNYLSRGIAMYESLEKHSSDDFVLWVLCLDRPTEDILQQLHLKNVRIRTLSALERWDPELLKAKGTRSRVEYYWTLTPIVPVFVFDQDPSIELITYVDADLYFYGDPKPVFEELGDNSILIVEHRFPPELRYLEINGVFNVGLLCFRRDSYGLGALQWWRTKCLEWCYARHEDGKFGDQKYLDDWPQRFSHLVVLQHEGCGLAPWNLRRFKLRFTPDGITVDSSPLVFFHFHGFRSLGNSFAIVAGKDYQITSEEIKHLYLPYITTVRRTEGKLHRLGADQSFFPKPVQTPHALTRLLRQEILLLHPEWLSCLLWRIGGWTKKNRGRVAAGFAAYQANDLRAACRYLLSAVLRNPFYLRDLSIISILMEPLIGTGAVNRLRYWRKRLRAIIHLA